MVWYILVTEKDERTLLYNSSYNYYLNLGWTFLHNSNLETIQHLFSECDYAKNFQKEVAWFIFSAYNKLFIFEIMNTIFVLGQRRKEVKG